MSRATSSKRVKEQPAMTEVPATRVDSAHELAGRAESGAAPIDVASADPSPDVLPSIADAPVADDTAAAQAAAGRTAESQEEHLHRQAAELAEHLQARLREVDRREAHLNAQLAKLESNERIARLWHQERQIELEEREAELHRQLEELKSRAAAIAAGEVNLESLDEYSQRLAEREQALQGLEAQLREQRQSLDREAHSIRHGQQMAEQFHAQQLSQLEAEKRRLAADFAERSEKLEQENARLLRELEASTAKANSSPELPPAEVARLRQQYTHLEQQLRDRHAAQVAELQAQFDEREQELKQHYAAREAELAAARERLNQQALEENARDKFEKLSADLVAEHRQRQQRLDELHRQLDGQRRELQKELQALADQRQAFQRQSHEQREAFLARVRAAENELETRRADLAAREASLDRQQESLERVRSEIGASQRQILEMRLVAEQLWAQVTGRLSSAEVTQSIAHLRLQLAEHYRLQQDVLVDQKTELVRIGERIQQQHQALVRQRDDLKSWACTQQSEIERQAQRLVTRELELDEQQQQMERLQHQWLQERRGYESQIRQLLAQRDRLPAAA